MKYYFWLGTLLTGLIINQVASAQIRLNEIYPGGSPEWVELYNTASTEANLIDWYVDDVAEKGSSPKKFSLLIPGLGFGIVELSSIFNNTGGDSVRLLDSQQTEIDHFDYTESVSSTDYFQRCPDGSDNWLLTSHGTQYMSNSTNCSTPTSTPTLQPTEIITLILTSGVSPVPTAQYTPPKEGFAPGVLLSEIMMYPDNEAEWVEIYNSNDFAVSLENWYLDDAQNAGSTPKKFSLSLDAKSYGTIELSSHIFNNDQDTVRLLNPDQVEQDSLEYTNPEKGASYSRQSFTNDASWCFTTASKNLVNNPCPQSETILATIAVLKISPTTQKSTLPNSFKLTEQFYRLESTKVLGAKSTNSNSALISQFSFWQRYTKIALWLNLFLNLAALVFLSWYLRDSFHLLPGWVSFLSFLIEKKSPSQKAIQ
ncbi:hypothetical protein A2313_01935 [Candidatus Roizmanbacteria bacterium RIFOXYB2_FULL_41_10]|uniref:LTD domain-containing protein n=1 Tax=Candidatus Roizmanbacteria bacterium RIFOXYA1_FULL_41_12 TaxID=1802082 RepID=A0A1F7KA37_9BACT|nr:MAG: hypothetical protein A2209_00185 [Candidatus Roizmanbacteria bacterium RIFOXYA1_FULL_41_12]OGK67548.1 MAG: hypothetical protein A2377_01740 [Candidatus Roizmanbacteria bacterium RIFOXYB1_FULL_41_27]OGK70954.1 MAG: hypothetical protein A2313_01935 [Candidatus Roizmanbacteria bacterium RIFOXYB2_FULL_41_10]OGK71204.1 MAG: hypothetical protein A2403_00470 [Candidatus Roizmanbacteria bacterium RIFOXYC1_FULL_41_16]OGK74732.1 MAG: hypothetical protein A2575_00285 [Candidatus Roizmanbacteria ba